ncbi:DUF982 domain-containing protein [Ensifer glycinis]|uniref:DUF982 domain-containing protein n=1 Tax=Sinorhizobium glycinis TaxID=1472378 RepID=UPI0009EEF455
MEHDRFRHPVPIFVGLGFPAEIYGVREAYAWLNEWPPSKRNPAHSIALDACKAALAGEIDAEIARTTLVACARRANLLAPDAGTIVGANRRLDALYQRVGTPSPRFFQHRTGTFAEVRQSLLSTQSRLPKGRTPMAGLAQSSGEDQSETLRTRATRPIES